MNLHREQRGMALGLVLIFLMVGTLMITPALTYTATGIHSEQISERKLAEQDTIDSAMVDAIWQILEAAALTKIDPETGTYAYDFEFGLDKWGVSIEIPFVGRSDWQALKVNMFCKIEVFPNWLEAQGEETFYYVFRLAMPQWDGVFSFSLPLGLEYDTLTAMDVGPEKQNKVDPDAEVNHENSQYKNKSGSWEDLLARYVDVDVMPDPPVVDTFYVLKEWVPGDSTTWDSITSGTTNNLNGVWGSSASDVYAVGDSGTILQYDGSTWSSMTSGTTDRLNSIWGTSASDVFAVGRGYDDDGEWGTILHYDGITWDSMTSGTNNNLNGVWGSSASDVYAVGDSGTILHYDGTMWSSMTSGTTNNLNSVWGSSASDVYAVGDSATILNFNGTSWSEIDVSALTTNNLNGVWGYSGSGVYTAYTVGDSATILNFDGTSWNEIDVSALTTDNLSGVCGRTPSDVFAVGASGTILDYDGSNWTSMTSGATSELHGVWPSSSSAVFAAGYSGTIRQYDCRQKLTWEPAFAGVVGLGTYILVFEATGTLGWGIHYLLPEFTESGELPVELAPTAGVASAMYNIIIKDDAGEPIISAVIGFTAEGEVVLISYEVIG